jgi:hypothetical protein
LNYPERNYLFLEFAYLRIAKASAKRGRKDKKNWEGVERTAEMIKEYFPYDKKKLDLIDLESLILDRSKEIRKFQLEIRRFIDHIYGPFQKPGESHRFWPFAKTHMRVALQKIKNVPVHDRDNILRFERSVLGSARKGINFLVDDLLKPMIYQDIKEFIEDLVPRSAIDRVEVPLASKFLRCDRCERFFLPKYNKRRSGQNAFCSSQCKDSFWNEKRKDYQRGYIRRGRKDGKYL